MAFDASIDQEEQNKQPGAQIPGQLPSQQPGQPASTDQQNTNLSGGSTGLAGSGGAPSQSGGATPAAQKPTASGSWTNLSTYLGANQDQASKIGSDVASGVETQAKQTQADLGGLQTAFQNQDPYKALNNTTSNQVAGAFADPSQYANGGDTSQALKYLNGGWGTAEGDITKYQGAAGTPSWTTVANDYTKANQNLAATQSEAGRGTLLQNQYGQGGMGYNQGEKSFDQLLLQQDPNAQGKLSSVYNQYAPSLLKAKTSTGTDQASQDQNAAAAAGMPLSQWKALQDSMNYAKGETAKSAGFQTQASDALNQQIAALGKNLQGEEAANSKEFGKSYEELKNALLTGQISDDEAKKLGVDPNVNTYNLSREDLAKYLTAGANPYQGGGAANASASQKDWQNFAGLQALLGGTSNNASQVAALGGVGLTGTQADQIKAPQASPYAFDSANFNAAINNAKSGYDQAYVAKNQNISQNLQNLLSTMPGYDYKSGISAADLERLLTDSNATSNPLNRQPGFNPLDPLGISPLPAIGNHLSGGTSSAKPDEGAAMQEARRLISGFKAKQGFGRTLNSINQNQYVPQQIGTNLQPDPSLVPRPRIIQ